MLFNQGTGLPQYFAAGTTDLFDYARNPYKFSEYIGVHSIILFPG